MKVLIRTVVTFISAVATLYFVYWVGGALIFSLHQSPWIASLGSLAAATAVARYVWMHTTSLQGGLVSSVVVGR